MVLQLGCGIKFGSLSFDRRIFSQSCVSPPMPPLFTTHSMNI